MEALTPTEQQSRKVAFDLAKALVAIVIRCQPTRMCKACLETDSNLSWMFDREMHNPLPDQCFGTRGA